jgi:single-stranded-DNA-specific exonuclease
VLGSKARWNIGKTEDALIQEFTSNLQINPLVAKLLILRNIQTVEQAQLFLHGGQEHFHDPYLLDGLSIAVERIRLALGKQEKIRVYGDYDADGVSSTSLMVHLLRGLGANFDTYIPHRVKEGYGLNRNAVDLAKEQGVSLLITVDTGISAVDEINYIQELGMDVIVTDHHEPPEVLPKALAVINPKKPGCPYPFKQLAGVGVAFKLAHAMLGRIPEELLEIAAIGTVADLMPLVDENRLIVKLGLERMQSSAYAGIRALLGVAGVERKEVTATHIGFALAPRINASGRLEGADDAVRLLTTSSDQEAEHIAFELDALNKERQRIVQEITHEAMVIAEQQREQGFDKVIVVAKEGWNVGVIGIVASKIVEKFYRPTIVLSIDPDKGIAKGSARSIAGYDMYQALTACKEWLDHYGGHQAAAGMTLQKEHLGAFSARLNELAAEWMSDEDFIPVVQVDAECLLQDVPLSAIEQLEKLAPFGMGNPAPKFVFKELKLEDIRTMGKEKQHLKLGLSQSFEEVICTVEAVGFGKGKLSELIAPTARLDVLGELSVNEWNGVRKPQIMLQDLRIGHLQLFDWRGTANPETKLAYLVETLEVAVDSKAPAIVLFSDSELEIYQKAHSSANLAYPLWTLDHAGNLQAGNEKAQKLSFAQMRDVILYSIPRRIQDLRQVLIQASSVERWYALFKELGYDSGGGMPSREMFKLMYATLQQQGSWNIHNRGLMNAFSKRSGLSPSMIEFMIRVFEELGFMELVGQDYKPHPAPAKRDLTTSKLYQDRIHRNDVEQIIVYSSAKELEQWIIEQAKQPNLLLEEII